MKIKIKFFASLAEVTGISEMEVTDCSTMIDLKNWLQMKFPEIESRKYAVAVNKAIDPSITVFRDGDEIALLPPFSGG